MAMLKTDVCRQCPAALKLVWPLLTTLLWVASVCPTNAQPVDIPDAPAPTVQPQPLTPPPLPGVLAYGQQISVNGRTLPGAWLQRRGKGGKVSTHLADAAMRQYLGADLLNTGNPQRQPVSWFTQTTFATLFVAGDRYLDITNWAGKLGWRMQVSENTLFISTPVATVTEIQPSQPLGDVVRVVVDLDRPAPWQITPQPPAPKPKPVPPPLGEVVAPLQTPPPPPPPNREWLLTIDAGINPALLLRYPLQNTAEEETIPPEVPPQPTFSFGVTSTANQTMLKLSIPPGLNPRVSTTDNPNRVVIEIRPDALVERDILWAQGLRWRQQYVSVAIPSPQPPADTIANSQTVDRFGVVWLEVNPRTVGMTIKPMWAEPRTLVGTMPVLQMAPRYRLAAAINGGFFNRKTRLPLGAIRRDGRWLSSPILNRGAIAWNNSGQVRMARLTYQETLITSTGQKLLLTNLNSGYLQPGIARYTADWGNIYTPLSDNETILVVQNQQIINQIPGGLAIAATPVPIPVNGYLLVVRNNTSVNTTLTTGIKVKIDSSTSSVDLDRYPHIIGAGPLLVQNRQVVLDAAGEKFSTAFIAEKAARSIICTTSTGNLMIAAVHERVGGVGPTLAEVARIMQQMGCIDALNLDGGSSTSLYLGGQLINRPPQTAARVHNGIGIFLRSRP